MAGTTYTIGEVAKTLGLVGKNSSTVRLWTETFADWLSPLTRPVKGQLRLYTEEDVRSLRLVRDLRRQHLSYDEVRQRLSTKGRPASVQVGGVSIVDSLADPEPEVVVDARELRELLAPVFEVSEALRRFLKESDYSVGIHLELGRLASSVESLNAKLDRLRHDLETIREELKAPAESGRFDRSGGSDVSAGEVAALEVATSGEETGLNEYGLRAVPDWLIGRSLGEFSLCRLCGSSTKPIGVTPTARAVLLCIQCRERAVVPLAQLEKGLEIRRGFLARLWQLLRHPLPHR